MSRISKRRRKMGQPVGISILNLIDVIFILLIFFMIATTFDIYQQIEINLPEVNRSSTEELNVTAYDIIIDKKKNYFLKYDDEIIEISKENLLNEISKMNEQTTVTLSADSEIEYQLIMEIMSELRNRNIQSINLAVTDNKNGGN